MNDSQEKYLVVVRIGSFTAQNEGTDYLETVEKMSLVLKRVKKLFLEEKRSQIEVFRVKGDCMETISHWTFPQNKDTEIVFGEYVPPFNSSRSRDI